MTGPGNLPAGAQSIHRQELSWTSPSAWGNSNGEPRAVFHDPLRGLSGGQ